jgi:hypothetical protein
VAIIPPGRFSAIRMTLGPLDGEAVNLPEGLVVKQDYRGIELPTFYSARMTLPDSDQLPLGTAGRAKIFGVRRSLFRRFVTVVANLVRSHVW